MRIKKMIKRTTILLSKNVLLHNVNRTHYQKNALLVYITRPFVKKEKEPSHSNYLRALIIGKVLNEFGYNLDVIYFEFTRSINTQKYDVILGMGDGYTRISNKCNKECKKIYLATGTCFTIANQEELVRWINLYNKGKGFVGADRIEKMSNPIKTIAALYESDAILSVGETDWVINSFRRINPNVYSIGTVPLVNKTAQKCEKQVGSCRKGVLFLCGNGCIHKGLDIIVEVFTHRENFALYICGNIEKEFMNAYKKELLAKNIFLNKFVNINSKEFVNICTRCCFVINMSCSEGCCTSVLTGMAAGLIPIITKAEGINITEDSGFILEKADNFYLNKCLDSIEQMETAEIERKMKMAQDVINQNYTMDICEARFRKCLKEIL